MDTNILNIKCASASVQWWLCVKQHHLSNIWSSIQEKVKQHRLSWEKKTKNIAYEKSVYSDNASGIKTLENKE